MILLITVAFYTERLKQTIIESKDLSSLLTFEIKFSYPQLNGICILLKNIVFGNSNRSCTTKWDCSLLSELLRSVYHNNLQPSMSMSNHTICAISKGYDIAIISFNIFQN